ncbi:hypothetical protein AVEN_228280-1 [Araneus ventricosus]|uniref:Uncharacterized protein n=1 Tax=Araneus ventricosus TaxID=182803 RepID=A0A4Y2EBY5_ARAVE|nr:hypothetical protein AVEN_228280-1 [Araneus ventricosus]
MPVARTRFAAASPRQNEHVLCPPRRGMYEGRVVPAFSRHASRWRLNTKACHAGTMSCAGRRNSHTRTHATPAHNAVRQKQACAIQTGAISRQATKFAECSVGHRNEHGRGTNLRRRRTRNMRVFQQWHIHVCPALREYSIRTHTKTA